MGYTIQDAGCGMWDTGYRMWDTGLWDQFGWIPPVGLGLYRRTKAVAESSVVIFHADYLVY